ncbi:OLC1v1018387C1 [Oldenlandia corymbosa var. corymbosa]|uniref:OLC1v1018387C1 n=1 Tax=Oldenlandia corymbosa var. corymbosa TaxID=529605 RepID=A0AAV1EBG3_OLDCO|nr:OLC1v1018387C1 [Oldenlandia corymbosa var. corymbosa]
MAAGGLNFIALRNMQDSVNDLLHSPGIKTATVHREKKKFVHEISEASLKMVETCGNTRDVLLLVKDHLHDLKSTFRRVSVGPATTDMTTAAADGTGNKFSGYTSERKKLKKAMLRRLNSLKMMKSINNNGSSTTNVSSSHDLVVVINVLREVRMATMAIVESLMSLMSMPLSPETVNRSPAKKKKSSRGFFELSKFSRVNSLSYWENCDRTTLQVASQRLAAVEIDVEDLEEELDCSNGAWTLIYGCQWGSRVEFPE